MSTHPILRLNPQLCVRQERGNAFRVLRDWHARPLGRPATAETLAEPPPVGFAGPAAAREEPRPRLGPRILAALMGLVLLGSANLCVWGKARVDDQRRTYHLAKQLRRSEAMTHRLATENRALNAWVALSQARALPANTVIPARGARPKPVRPTRI